MARLLGVFRTTVFLGWLCVMLVSTTVAAGIWAVQMTAQVTALTAQVAATALAHRKQLAKTKAKARLRRAIIAFPLVGAGAGIWFEKQDYQEWLAENDGGTRQQYACEVAALTAEVIDEVLQDLPASVTPSPDLVASWISDCDAPAPAPE